MNSKKKNFIITNSIVIVFVLLLSLLTNYLLTSLIGFNKDTFVLITIVVLLFGVGLYFFLSKPILEPLFKSDENLQKTVKQTLHELNIPISTINLNTQMLEKSISDEKTLKRLNRIQQASNELLKLYEQMEYNIKKEIDKIDIEEFDAKELIENSLNKIEDVKQNIKVEKNIKSNFIKTDKNGFEKVIDNLLSNAIKYNQKENGKIIINLENNILEIFNTGKSIDAKNLINIFEKYFQENSSNNGFGLGLSMVKEFCDKQRIEIKINTQENGNSFILNLNNLK